MVGDGLVVDGQAIDQPHGRIALVRASVDGGPWQVLASADGLYDEAAEGFSGTLPQPGKGAHDIVVQAWDAAGNVAAKAITITLR